MPGKKQKKTTLVDIGPIRPMADFWGRPLKRYVSGSALRRALQASLLEAGSPLIESLAQLTGTRWAPKDVQGVRARLFQEGDYQYVFKVAVRTHGRRPVELAMIVAKNEGSHSRLAASELQNLVRLHHRLGRYFVKPLGGGALTLTEGSVRYGKRLFFYFTEWLHRFHELGVDRGMNFYVNEIPFHHFDRRETDRIKGRILHILFSSYDPVGRRAMEPPRVGAGDIVITRPGSNDSPELKVIACRRILAGVSLRDCLGLYLGYHGDWAGNVFHLVPKDLGMLQEAIRGGLLSLEDITPEKVLRALRAYADCLSRGPGIQEAWHPQPMLKRLLDKTEWIFKGCGPV